MSDIIEKWAEIKTIIESIDLDVNKNAGGNASAGVRARKGLRLLKKEAAELVKMTVAADKERKANN
mgnify:FL=1|tara:strand:- start:651 stop:848 length:198 start_codon:yes stop_codon:yes gene_type:complete